MKKKKSLFSNSSPWQLMHLQSISSLLQILLVMSVFFILIFYVSLLLQISVTILPYNTFLWASCISRLQASHTSRLDCGVCHCCLISKNILDFPSFAFFYIHFVFHTLWQENCVFHLVYLLIFPRVPRKVKMCHTT